ncbi:hypothetical protein GCM10023310_54300 [Paenibacillus vulneris]|uniref:Histidine kinase domain-containing protein n=1 Tax=Paenibacillus vulneris TaxID=1133364 RepID=A0ABW3UZF0_9BACL
MAGNDELNTKVKDMVTQIQVAGSHMNSVITHHEQFIKSGKIHASETEITEIIKEALVLTSIKTKENNVHIDLIEEKQVTAIIDKDKIRQVFINLINNSIVAMEGKEHKSITIRTSRNNNEIHILFAQTAAQGSLRRRGIKSSPLSTQLKKQAWVWACRSASA